MASSSMASKIKAYSIPLILFFGALFYQLVVIPKSFPSSHYDTLQIKKYSSIDEVKEAYEKLSSNWNSSVDIPVTHEFLKLQYAYELLSNPSWKRNYDTYGIDEHLDVLQKAKERFLGNNFSTIDLPLLDSATPDSEDHNLEVTSSDDLKSMFEDTKPLLIQLFSFGSKSCLQFSDHWRKIASLLDGVANTASVELGDLQLVAYLAEKQPTGQLFFRNGIPSLVALPSGCKTADCLIRYTGELSVHAITDWFSTYILGLPRIYYYTKETLGQKFLATVSSHKVKVIIFSKTGERASPSVRQAAKTYWSHASFAFVLWQEEESSFWFNTFEVESAPAIVFLKDPGAKPVVYHGAINNTMFSSIMEQNKQQDLPQLRGTTSAELGCDPRGFSRAGIDTSTWYCAIVAGRIGPELNKMREAIRRVKESLSQDSESSEVDNDQSTEPAAVAFKNKRLTFTWLDGEEEKKYCFFYVNSETSYDTCGPRRDIVDVPRLFIIRYKRNATEDAKQPEKKRNSIFDALQDQDLDPAAQLVAKYNGSDEISEITKWISHIISDGDSKELPHYRTRTPELVSVDSQPIWSKGVHSLPTTTSLNQRFRNFITKIHDLTGDPRVGPFLLLGALMSFGSIWLHRNQSTPQSTPNVPASEDDREAKRKDRARKVSNKSAAASITDDEPKNASQIQFSDSDSD